MKLSPHADYYARILRPYYNRNGDWDLLRDEIDALTGSELTAYWLDRLTDMVRRRLPLR